MKVSNMNNAGKVPTIDDYLKRPAHPLRQTGGCRLDVKQLCDPKNPLVSVITIVKNRQETLPKTIISVLSQNYRNIEYIIMDGASTDGTLEVIRRFNDKINLWISEPDFGTSDAFNNGVSLAGGEFIFWLSSDDWIDPDFINEAVKTILNSGADFVFGDMAMHGQAELPVVYKGDRDCAKSLMSGYQCINTPTIVIKRECFQKSGLLDLTYKFINDYELILRFYLNGGVGFYNDSLVVHRRVGGVGENYLIRSALEHWRLLRQYNLPKTKVIVTYYLYYLVRRKMGQFANLLRPSTVYKKLKRITRGR